MDIVAERIFERGVAMSFMDPAIGTTNDNAKGQKGLSPEGFANNGPATSHVHGGHTPSSRLVGGPFLAKQQYP